MASDYEERKQARIERFRELADKARHESTARYNAMRRIADMIPFGQPILIGHHSERGARADVKRMDGHMQKSIESGKKAEYYDNRADAAESNRMISSDDPAAVEKLREKLAKLETMQDMFKRTNAAHRAYLKNPASLDKADLPESVKDKIRTYVPRYSCEPSPIPPYEMQNNNGNMKRIRERIAQLEKQAAVAEIEPEAKTLSGDGWEVIEDREDNRLCIVFDAKPDEGIRTRLKRNGFRWSPTRGAWVRQLNNGARAAAEYAMKSI